MHRVLSCDLWHEVAAVAAKAKRKRVAIAYVTQELIEFQKGDVLICDASPERISSGDTDAPLLRSLQERSVLLYDCPGLHAKLMLLDNTVVIGSANMSNNSQNNLVEAAVMTDQSSIVAGVASLIEQLIEKQATKLSTRRIAELCKIEVKRRGGGQRSASSKRRMKIRPLGNQTWLIGVQDDVREPSPSEKKLTMAAARELEVPEEELSVLRWPSKHRFAKECRDGDVIIQIRRVYKAKEPYAVFGPTGILKKKPGEKQTRIYFRFADVDYPTLKWNEFKRLVAKVGYTKKPGPTVVQLIDPEMSDWIGYHWRSGPKAMNRKE